MSSSGSQGVMPKHVRFQVSLATPLNVLILLKPAYRVAIEPIYEASLLRALAAVQAAIPADQLAIQFDMALDMGMIEGVPWIQPWFEVPVLAGVVERVLRFVSHVDENVDLGFHLCYGDLGHKHFLEPVDTAKLVTTVNAIMEGIKRLAQWFHMPVPKARDDVQYFVPLKELELRQETKLYLGFVQADDFEGTLNRIEAAQKANMGHSFGIATECGTGRTPVGELDSVFTTLKRVSDPVI